MPRRTVAPDRTDRRQDVPTTITLTPEQQAWIDAHVAQDECASVEEAARGLLDDAIAHLWMDDDDLAWAKPLVDEALGRGRARRDGLRLASLRGWRLLSRWTFPKTS